MPLLLPRARVLPDRGVVLDTPGLPNDLARLVERLHSPERRIDGDCVLPLDDAHWLVGRRSPRDSVWRIVDLDAYQRASHPAWLWTEVSALAVDAPLKCPTPVVLPLRLIMRNAANFSGSYQATSQVLAATVAALRRRDGPVAVVAPRAAFQTRDHRARWFVLALLTVLPPRRRGQLWLSTYEPLADPDTWDLVLTDKAPAGFQVVDGLMPEMCADDAADIVPAFVRDRLLANDPEAIEAAAYLEDDAAADPWAAGLRRHLATGVPGVSRVTAPMLQHDPEAAVQACTWRLRAGAAVSDEVATELASVTARTADPRPWRELSGRPGAEISRALTAWLSREERTTPRHDLLEAILGLGPRGPGVELLAAEALDWLDRGLLDSRSLPLLGQLLAAATDIDAPVRASLWAEWLRLLHRESMLDPEHLYAGIGTTLIDQGMGGAAVAGWLSYADLLDDPADSGPILDALVHGPGADHHVALLLWGLQALGRRAQAEQAVRGWVHRLATASNPVSSEEVLAAVRSSGSLAGAWADQAGRAATGVTLRELVRVVAPDGESPLWARAMHARVAECSPRDALVAVGDLLPEGIAVAEPALQLLGPALTDAGFPDRDITAVALRLARPDTSSLWPLTALCASVPGQFDDPTIDATVIAFCERPPQEEAHRELARRCLHGLAHAERWKALDHARWVVRFVMAPDESPDKFAIRLAHTLLMGIAAREDAVVRMATITNALLELPPEHPALFMFLRLLLPNAWPGPMPEAFVQRVDVTGLAPSVGALLRQALST